MPLQIFSSAPTLLVHRAAFERAGLSRAAIEAAVVLTADEFRVERDLIAIGPLHGAETATALLQALEEAGIDLDDEVFELTGNWPEWLDLYAAARRPAP